MSSGNDDGQTNRALWFLVIIAMIAQIAVIGITAEVTHDYWRGWAVRRGVARYSPQSGKWEETPYIEPAARCR